MVHFPRSPKFPGFRITKIRTENGIELVVAENVVLVPEYIGTWNTKEINDGLFAVFPIVERAQGKAGIILDGLGAASFEEGEFGEGVRFVKRYQRTRRSDEAAKHAIVYSGRKIEVGSFKGDYECIRPSGGLEATGEFFLWHKSKCTLSKKEMSRVFGYLLNRAGLIAS